MLKVNLYITYSSFSLDIIFFKRNILLVTTRYIELVVADVFDEANFELIGPPARFMSVVLACSFSKLSR
jgi:hypothetical protein